MTEEKICAFEECDNTFTSFMPTKKYCHKSCAKAACYRRNKETYKAYERKNRKKINARSLKNYHDNKEKIIEQRKISYAKLNNDKDNIE